MNECELLTVVDSFEINGRGTVLVPDFSVPIGWQDREELVSLVLPDGQRIAMTARFELTHFSLTDPEASPDKRWRVVVLLAERTDKMLVGSKLFVPAECYRAVVPESAS